MLVGILSMQRIVNYGSFMQAYSLKKMVESLGHKVVFVDYKTNVLIEDRNDKTRTALSGNKRWHKISHLEKIWRTAEKIY